MKRVKKIDLNTVDLNKSYLEIDGVGWRTPKHVSIQEIVDVLNVIIPDMPDPSTASTISLYQFVPFDEADIPNVGYDITFAPAPMKFSVDEDFLYVMTNDKWKRTPLSSF